MGASLTVEGSHDPARLAANTRAALRRMARIMLPVAGVLFFGAPWILGVFGQGYADAATPLLRWFAVGAVLRVVMETYFAVLRAQSRTAGLAWLQGLLCVLVLGLTLILLPRMGLTGAGVAEISSLAVIVALAAPQAVPDRQDRAADAVPEDAAPDGDLADLGAREVPASQQGSAGKGRGPAWAQRLDTDTLALGVQLDFDHLERRPDVRPGPGTPPTGTPTVERPEHRSEPRPDHRPTWALKAPLQLPARSVEVGLPVEEREPGSETSLGPSEVEVDAPFERRRAGRATSRTAYARRRGRASGTSRAVREKTPRSSPVRRTRTVGVRSPRRRCPGGSGCGRPGSGWSSAVC